MNDFLQSIFIIPSAILVALISFWSAANVESLKKKFEHQRLELNIRLQTSIEAIKLENDRSIKAYELHVKREYELYEDIYPKLIDAYYAFINTKRADDEPDALEESGPNGKERTREEIEVIRRERLSEALDHLSFMDPVIKRKPLINNKVFSEIENFWRMGMDTYLVRNYPALYSPPFSAERKEHSEQELNAQLNIISELIKRRLRIMDA